MTEKKYIGGTAKAVSTQYGEMMNLSLKLEDMKAIVNEKGYVNMTVMKRKEVGKFGDTHYVVENNYKKEGATQEKYPDSNVSISDLPW